MKTVGHEKMRVAVGLNAKSNKTKLKKNRNDAQRKTQMISSNANRVFQKLYTSILSGWIDGWIRILHLHGEIVPLVYFHFNTKCMVIAFY